MTINMHAHMGDVDVDERVEHYRHPEITHTVMFSNDDKVAEGMRKYPDFVIGFGQMCYPDAPSPDKIREFVDRGFKGVKIIGMRRPIDDPSMFPMYEAMVEHGLPAFFHMGFLSIDPGRGPDGAYQSMLFMRPGRLDTLGRVFPELVMIAAHLGAPWYEEACSALSKHPNVYFDMSGGTVKHRPLSHFRGLFTRGAGGGFLRDEGEELDLEKLGKLVFGTDNPAPPTMLEFYHNFCDKLGVDAETRHRIMTGNAAAILGLEGV